MISARSDDKRRRYFGQLLEELEILPGKATHLASATAGDGTGSSAGGDAP
ncbi:hypothetical protein ACLB1Q_25500 [Escherichia coli]